MLVRFLSIFLLLSAASVASLEIVQPSESAGEYASPTLGVGPESFDVPGFVVLFEGEACDRSSGRKHSDALAGNIAAIRDSHSCSAKELAEFAQDAGAIGAIVVSKTANPGSLAFSYDGDDHDGIAIPSIHMSTFDWDSIGFGNGTFAVMRPTENPWRNVKARWQWAMFSALFGSIAIVELIACVWKFYGYLIEYGTRPKVCGISVYAARWALPEIVLVMEAAAIALRIVFFVDPGSVNKVYTSDTSVSLLTSSFPLGIATSILVAFYWLHLLANDFKPPSKKSTISLGRWKWPCVGVIATVILLEVVNNMMANVYPPSNAVSGAFSGALYGLMNLGTSVFFFYENWKMKKRMKSLENPTPGIIRFVRKLNFLMFVSGIGSVLVFTGPFLVFTGVVFDQPAGFVFVYWDMYTGLSLQSGSQISMFDANRSAQTNTKTTTMTKMETVPAPKEPGPDSEVSETSLSSESE